MQTLVTKECCLGIHTLYNNIYLNCRLQYYRYHNIKDGFIERVYYISYFYKIKIQEFGVKIT